VSFALDVNILLYALYASSALHAEALAFLHVVDPFADC
jgi:predicted nucleic acid-binding protein